MEQNISSSTNLTSVGGYDLITYKRLVLMTYFHRMMTYAGPPLTAFGLLTNILSIITMMGATMRKRVTSIYLSALALADMANIIKVNFVWLQRTMQLPFSVSCSWLHLFISGSFSTSTWIIVAITVDRMIAVCYPLKARTFLTKRRSMITVVLIFFFSYFIYLPTLFYVKDDSLICNSIRSAPNWYSRWGRFSTCLLSWSILPTIVLCTLNTIIARQIKKRLTLGGKQDAERLAETRWLTKMCLTVTIFYGSFTIPNNIAVIVLKDFKIHIINNKVADIICGVTVITVICNYSCNFLLYCFSSASFRKTFLDMWRCGGRKSLGSSKMNTSSGTRSTDRTLDFDSMQKDEDEMSKG
ncbi:hypothetical protein LSH36_776g00067 [Paralvinella palmiformis]|uniref:G-protein coupled receptors family 1 profile domain-containing protein n=1 Tax=Paralvinella palmiformis TaxID=53620 RepID=A0AAD9MSV9_9ANNE|nr:hypothetical protein LSH36_776g00067 [Paralvinella palmiformis]